MCATPKPSGNCKTFIPNTITDMSNNDTSLPVIRTFDFGGVPMVDMPHLANINGRQLAEIIVRCFAHNHPDLVHPDAPQLA
jgi:hypothetical protein